MNDSKVISSKDVSVEEYNKMYDDIRKVFEDIKKVYFPENKFEISSPSFCHFK